MRPRSMASSAEMVPTPWLRSIQIRLRVSSRSHSSMHLCVFWTTARMSFSRPGSQSRASPPMRP